MEPVVIELTRQHVIELLNADQAVATDEVYYRKVIAAVKVRRGPNIGRFRVTRIGTTADWSRASGNPATKFFDSAEEAADYLISQKGNGHLNLEGDTEPAKYVPAR